MEQVKKSVYARVNSDGAVVSFFSDVFEKPLNDDVLIESGNEDYHSHVHLKYKSIDEKGLHNYKVVNGVLTEITNEEKEIEEKAKHRRFNTKSDIVKEIKYYKFEYIRIIQYDGHPQKYDVEDKILMSESQEVLEKGIYPSINWKFQDNNYVTVTDAKYLFDMRLAGGVATEKAFNTEYILLQEINSTAMDKLYNYPLEEKFDAIYKTITITTK